MANSSPNNNHTEQYAQQWIDFLKQRNNVLSVLLFLMIVFSLGLGLAAFYYFQQNQTSLLESNLYEQKIEKLELTLKQKEALISDSSSSFNGIKGQHEILSKELSSLETELAESKKQLGVKQDMIDNLSSQNILLKEENGALEASLSQVRESLLNGATNSEVLAEENQRLVTENKNLSKKLKDSKTAYLAVVKRQKEAQSELDVLVDQNYSLKQKDEKRLSSIKSLNNEINTLKTGNIQLQSELDRSRKEFAILEEKLASIVSPISGNTSPKVDVSTPVNSGFSSAAPVISGDGLEEIKVSKPVVVPKTKEINDAEAGNSSPSSAQSGGFNYEEISVY